MIKISLQDGLVREFRGISVMEIAEQISARLAKDALAAHINGHLIDVSSSLNEDGQCRY